MSNPQSITVGTSSLMILPPRQLQIDSIPAWANATAYAQGSLVRIGARMYFAVIGGTSGASQPAAGIADTVDNTVTWRWIPTGKRNGAAIVNDSTNILYTSFGYAAVANKGQRLNASGGSLNLSSDNGDSLQSAVYGIASGAGSNVAVQEW